MLTLAEAARKNALQFVRPDHLVRWRSDVRAKCIALIQAEFNKTEFAQIGDLDIRAVDGPLDDALSDATYHLIWEME